MNIKKVKQQIEKTKMERNINRIKRYYYEMRDSR